MPSGLSFAALMFVIAQGAPQIPAATSLGVRAGAAFRTGDVAPTEPPRVGVAFGLVLGHRFTTLASDRVGLGAQLELAYARHWETVALDTVDAQGMAVTLDVARMVGVGDFTALAVVDRVHGRLRPWGGVGGGLRVGYYAREQLYDPTMQPDGFEGTPTRPVAQLAAGAEWTLHEQLAIGGRLDYLHTLGAGTPAFPDSSGGLAPALRDGVLLSATMSSRF